jgi:outer membrane protein OmpA-like peptidoglycan-associated protein
MKILIIGFLAFCSWSSYATYLYVCKIRGMCDGPATMQASATNIKNDVVVSTIQKPLVQQQIAAPKDMITYFAFDKSDFNANPETDQYLDKTNTYLDQNTEAKLSITGYTDAIGTEEYNMALGYRRAQRMQHYFESKGILADKIIIESKGKKEPADINTTSAGRANNRRTVITLKK